MQAPDAAQDSFGQFHIRGEHNGLQYRLNGIILPEGISVFGQTLDPRLFVVEPDHRRAAGRIRPAHRGHHRPQDQERDLRSGRLGFAVRRQPRGIEPSFSYGGSAGACTTSSPAIFCATISVSSRPTAAPIRFMTTPSNITALAISRTSSTMQTA